MLALMIEETRVLKASAPVTKADIDAINARLTRIEQSIRELGARQREERYTRTNADAVHVYRGLR